MQFLKSVYQMCLQEIELQPGNLAIDEAIRADAQRDRVLRGSHVTCRLPHLIALHRALHRLCRAGHGRQCRSLCPGLPFPIPPVGIAVRHGEACLGRLYDNAVT